MSSQTVNVLLGELLSQQGQREASQRQLVQNSMLATLETFLNLLANAQSPEEIKAAYGALNRQWKTMTKDVPGAPTQLVSELTVESAVRLAERDMQIRAPLVQVTTDLTAGLLSGRVSIDQAQTRMSEAVTGLSKKFGEGAVSGPAAAASEALSGVFAQRAQDDLQRLELKVQHLIPQLVAIAQQGTPNMNIVLDEALKLDLSAQAEVMGRWGINAEMDNADSVMLGAGARSLGLDVEQLRKAAKKKPELIQQATQAAYKLFRAEVEDTENRMFSDMLEKAAVVTEAGQNTAAATMNAVLAMSGELLTPTGGLTPKGEDFFSNGFREMAEKYHPIEGEPGRNTSTDATELLSTVYSLAQKGVFDRPEQGIKVSDATPQEFSEMVESGAIQQEMERLQVDGLSLFDILVDRESGLVRPYAKLLVTQVDVAKLRGMDPDTWDFLAASADAGPPLGEGFKTRNGLSVRESLVHVADDDATGPAARALGTNVGSFLSRIGRFVSRSGGFGPTARVLTPGEEAFDKAKLFKAARELDQAEAAGRVGPEDFKINFSSPLLAKGTYLDVLARSMAEAKPRIEALQSARPPEERAEEIARTIIPRIQLQGDPEVRQNLRERRRREVDPRRQMQADIGEFRPRITGTLVPLIERSVRLPEQPAQNVPHETIPAVPLVRSTVRLPAER